MGAAPAGTAVPVAASTGAQLPRADRAAAPAVRASVLLIATDVAVAAPILQALRQLEVDEAALHGPFTDAASLKARLAEAAAADLALVVQTPPQAPPERQQAEADLRNLLCEARVPYAIVDATDGGCLRAVAAVRAELRPPAPPRWRWICADCDDGECESHLAASPPAASAAAPAATAIDASPGASPAETGMRSHGA